MKWDFDEYLCAISIILLLILIFLTGMSLGADAEKDIITKKLCQKQVYDFCKAEITYKIEED